jgi:hypothetical protein
LACADPAVGKWRMDASSGLTDRQRERLTGIWQREADAFRARARREHGLGVWDAISSSGPYAGFAREASDIEL